VVVARCEANAGAEQPLERARPAGSRDRRILHDEIDVLRARIDLPRWRQANGEFDL
jgi:hypothetical protein